MLTPILAFCLLPLTASAGLPGEPLPPAGIGLNGISWYSNGSYWAFADAFQQVDMKVFTDEGERIRPRRRVGRPGLTEEAYSEIYQSIFNEKGWPVHIPEGQHLRALLFVNPAPLPTGEYLMEWEGSGEIEVETVAAFERVSEDRDSQTRTIRFELPESNEAVGGDGAAVTIFIREVDPDDPIRNIRFWMPGPDGKTLKTSDSRFTPWFKRVLEPFAYLRFMDWADTNRSHQENWEDRRPADYATQTGWVQTNQAGVAWEIMIEVCNELGKHFWLCVPERGTDAYVRELAKLVEAQLDPELKVYVEYSNEIWNTNFTGTHHAAAKGEEVGLTFAQWYGLRSARLWEIFEEELQDDERIVRIVGTHYRGESRSREAMQGVTFAGAKADALATTYYTGDFDLAAWAARNIDYRNPGLQDFAKTFAWLEESREVDVQYRVPNARVADEYGIPLIAYEGNISIFLSKLWDRASVRDPERAGGEVDRAFVETVDKEAMIAFNVALHEHPMMYQFYYDTLNMYAQAGLRHIGAFVDAARGGYYGCWGHMQGHHVEPEEAPRMLALIDWIEDNRQPPEAPVNGAAKRTVDGKLLVTWERTKGNVLAYEVAVPEPEGGQMRILSRQPETSWMAPEGFNPSSPISVRAINANRSEWVEAPSLRSNTIFQLFRSPAEN
ncbi:MAG: hypothetical protein ACFB21_08170 [Opitutales bacterium]